MMELLYEYMRVYGEEYLKKDPRTYRYIMKNFGEIYNESALAQVHAFLGIYEEYNFYREYFELLKKYEFLTLNLIEIGSGHNPILSKYIDEYQTSGCVGSITAQDPLCVVKKSGNIRIIVESFNFCTDIIEYDACIGIQPCDATEDIVDNAMLHNKDLFLALCDHPHFGDYQDGFYGGDYQLWENHIYRLIKRDLKDDKIIIREKLDKKYCRPYAIFIVIGKDKADVLSRKRFN